MRRSTLFIATALVAGIMAAAFTEFTNAENTTNNRTDRLANRTARTSTYKDAKAMGKNLRASEIIGMNIYNQGEESVGEINDIVLDSNTGKVRYAAVTYGGFLGVGDKMFAVPWKAFHCEADKDDPEDHHLVLNVTQKQLEGAQGFDQDNWPNFADRNFTDQIDKRYRVEHDRDVDVNVNRNGVDVDVNRRSRSN